MKWKLAFYTIFCSMWLISELLNLKFVFYYFFLLDSEWASGVDVSKLWLLAATVVTHIHTWILWNNTLLFFCWKEIHKRATIYVHLWKCEFSIWLFQILFYLLFCDSGDSGKLSGGHHFVIFNRLSEKILIVLIE